MNVVVCGAGVIGAACAYYLALRGARVTVVESVGVACAASGKSGGFLARDWCDNTPQQSLARLSFTLHQELAGALGSDYGYRPVTTRLVVASERRDVSAHARIPSPAWLDGGAAIANTLGDTGNTAQLEPALFTRALLDAACERGARLCTGRVESVVRDDGGRARGVLVNGRPEPAEAVILALGPWTGCLADALGLPPIAGLKGYSVVLQPTRPAPAEALFLDYETASGLRHSPEVVSRADGSVYVCGIGDTERPPDDPSRVSVDDDACMELARLAGELASGLKDARIVRKQACYRPVFYDAMPVMGECPGMKGAFVATGHNCWGMLNAPASGLAMSELVLDARARSVDLSPFSPERGMG